MNDPTQDDRADPAPGWGNLSTLDIKPRQQRSPEAFTLGLLAGLFVVGCALLSAAWKWRMHGGGSSPEMLGYAMGSLLAAFLLPYALGYLAYRVASRNALAGRITACVLAALVLVGNFGQVIAAGQQAREQRDALAKDLRRSADHFSRAAATDGPIAKLDSAPTAGGDPADLQLFMNTYFNKVIALQNEYTAELHDIGWDTVMDAQRIRDDAGLAESRIIIGRAEAAVAKYKARWVRILDETRASAQSMRGESAMKRGFAQGVIDSAEKANEQGMQIWDLEAEIVDTMGKLVSLLAESKGRWQVEGAQIAFDDEETLTRFNGYLARIDELVRREDAIRQAAMARTQRSLKELESH